MRHKRPFPKFPAFLCLVVIAVVVLQYRAYRSVSSPILDSSNIISGTILKDGVPAIDKPTFESVNVADQYLNNDGLGITVSVNGVSRFYPYQILVWHHVVNDVIAGQPLLITYNPFAMSGAAYQRTTQGTVLDFGLSDKLANSNLLLYDRATHSLWDPMTHKALEGEMKGITLTRYPSTVMTWNTFKAFRSNGQVLSRNTGYSRDYTHDPYGDYLYTQKILFPVAHKDDRLAAKALVYGIEWNQKQKAYPVTLLEKQSTIRDSIDRTNISIEDDATSGVVHAYQLDASGNHQNEIPVTPSFWFAWASAFPGTDLFN
ncbi:hypothetical protein A3C09_00840 [Candidatus Uhrbacteria bacterium RIFCSPHIGHO2_02_FULL_47_44]|uniref:DUF3179 domain-containing protein n=1 Tax=Candidatus Uhrbacteria bacterium RIFCSPLOWO2_02_FULL_48_18 TaxID=1802408 RepID=A0A1F7VC84_9BACT|nr:MAG: hypothetical protein A2839_05155 [Candidatus Uhrbacteria bacterium RIFCSPHIGHO2_01_FULL_47_10]OGL71501.1 MAG: hypothetical protein A3C09_00840 [Candidatus Uhrbacteria bacterium RIFCSPHIGHO2_02_FULL_47_44]OGL77680.1 MAG: hypothetical protein A3E97_04065 [Candidatus Uhrbacteria bacterium RIFCSPHIGHO2_12_FULL_47_12]OGL82387.1 MAG: hypothetical protein A3B20_01380 [Candidatus Uhrbacteria bacterium RIFCSPLOWO2_01_FULL_47_17]OGL88033.1 MAG: hypothetical protein A3I41_02910 [Candidatus Uhrbact